MLALTTKWVDVPARFLMSLLFLVSGVSKLATVPYTQGYMQSFGVPGLLMWPATALEIGGGILLLIGLGIRPLSVLLAGWCLLTAAIFHIAWSDQVQQVMFLKNMTMAGGFLMLAKSGSWSFSIDALLSSRKGVP